MFYLRLGPTGRLVLGNKTKHPLPLFFRSSKVDSIPKLDSGTQNTIPRACSLDPTISNPRRTLYFRLPRPGHTIDRQHSAHLAPPVGPFSTYPIGITLGEFRSLRCPVTRLPKLKASPSQLPWTLAEKSKAKINKPSPVDLDPHIQPSRCLRTVNTDNFRTPRSKPPRSLGFGPASHAVNVSP